MTDRRVHPIFEPLLDSLTRPRDPVPGNPRDRMSRSDLDLLLDSAHGWLQAPPHHELERVASEVYFGFRRAARAAFRERPELAPAGSHSTASGRRRPRAPGTAPRKRKPKPPPVDPSTLPAFRVVAVHHFLGAAYYGKAEDAHTSAPVASCAHRHRTPRAARDCGVRLLKAARPGQIRIV